MKKMDLGLFKIKGAINRLWPRYGHSLFKHKMCLSIMMAICFKQHLEVQFMKKLSNTEAELKKCAAYKKMHVICSDLKIKYLTI